MGKTKELPKKLREEIISSQLRYKKISPKMYIPRDTIGSMKGSLKHMELLQTCLVGEESPIFHQGPLATKGSEQLRETPV